MTQVRTDRLLELADIIEAGEPRANIQGFDMDVYLEEEDCGTVGCIAGWAVAVYAPDRFHDDIEEIVNAAAELLELDDYRADHLFCGGWTKKHLVNVTPAEAAAELRRLAAEHGEEEG